MATVPRQRLTREIKYPTRDGKPMAETELHLDEVVDGIQTLQDHFAQESRVHVGGNLLLFYEEGNPRKHVSPDVFLVFGIDKEPRRDHYLIWKEGKPPDFVLEMTSKTTRREDQKTKFELYRDTLKVPEYFLFDPREEFLKPSLQGFRLVDGDYVPIHAIGGRLPSHALGSHLGREGQQLRFFDPATGVRLQRRLEARDAAERQAAEASQRASVAEATNQRLADENERLRREIEALRRGSTE